MRRRRLVGSLGVLLVTAGCSDRGSQAPMGPSAAIAEAASGFSVTVALRCGSNVTAGQITSLTVLDATGAILSNSGGPTCEDQQRITGLAAKPARYEATIHVEHFDASGGGTADCPVNGTIPDRNSCVAPGNGTTKTLTGNLSIR